MIKVVCIQNRCDVKGKNIVTFNLTINKIYDADKNEFGIFYTIRNDVGNLLDYHSEMFIPLSEWREQQIKTILDE